MDCLKPLRSGAMLGELASRRLALDQGQASLDHQQAEQQSIAVGQSTMQIAAAALLYFAIVFGTGLVLGPIRVLWLEPQVGPFLAAICEAPFLITAMVIAARWVPGAVGLNRSLASLSLMGAGALALQQIADIIVGLALRGMTLPEQYAQFITPQGLVYAALLIAFALMPVLVGRRSH
jgi:hypothetical protein